MEWSELVQFLTAIGVNVGMFIFSIGLILWFSSKSSLERLESKLNSQSERLERKVDSNHEECLRIMNSIQMDIRDFHVRLYALEDRLNRK